MKTKATKSEKKVDLTQEPSKMKEETRDPKKRIERYSERNNRTKPGPENSTLKPETNSDSPSAKSNGERLVSASTATNKRKRRCKDRPANAKICREKMFNPRKRQKHNNRVVKETS